MKFKKLLASSLVFVSFHRFRSMPQRLKGLIQASSGRKLPLLME